MPSEYIDIFNLDFGVQVRFLCIFIHLNKCFDCFNIKLYFELNYSNVNH